MVKITDREFNLLSDFIYAELGIKMPYSKKTLLESRLQKRLRAKLISSFREYCDYLFSEKGAHEELVHMIDLVTTNKTDFFREDYHFEHLAGVVAPELVRTTGAGVSRKFAAWSAGCSSGEEPYTMSMVLSEFAHRHPGLGFDYTIFATDISTRMLQHAAEGTYREERIQPVPEGLRRKYLLRSRDRSRGLVRIIPELRERVRFSRLNFMDDDFGFKEPLDVIFCRNVVIYFDRATQEKLFSKFCRHLSPGSYLFIGHSESLNGFSLPLEKVGPAVYRRV